MAYPKKIKGETSMRTLRLDAKQMAKATAIAALKNETIADVLRRAVDLYVSEQRHIGRGNE